MANVLPGYIPKSVNTEFVMSRFTEYDNLGGLVAYPLGSTTPLSIDGTLPVNLWTAKKLGSMLHLTLRFQRNAGATALAGGTNGQYLIQLPDIVNIDTKRVGVSTGAVTDQALPLAIIGSGYIMTNQPVPGSNPVVPITPGVGLAKAVLYDSDAKTFRILLSEIAKDAAAAFSYQNSTDGEFSFGGASTALSMMIEFAIPVTD